MKCKIIIILLAISTYCSSQYKNTFSTPNAASLGLFGQIPVDYFNGLPQIDIPLYEFKSRNLTLPISLSYHAGNIKPSDHASWVGLGWSLQCGGVISRVVNDIPDEFIYYDYVGTGPNLNREKKGYFFNYTALAGSTWLGTTMTDEVNILFAGGVISEPTYSNLLYRKDKAPDEFQFNFMGMSGSMFMGQDGLWKFKTKQGSSFTVTFTMGNYRVIEPTSYPHIPAGSLIKNCITSFVLTASDGTQFTFGNTNTSIEFIRTSPGQPTSGSRDGGTVPTSWYLTKIKSVSGDEITLDYTRDGYQIMNNPGGVSYSYSCPTCTPGNYYFNGPAAIQADQLSILDGVTLSSITGANGSIQFEKAKAKILDYTINSVYDLPASTVQLFEAYGYEVFNGMISSGAYSIPFTTSTFMQLNKLIVKNSNNEVLKSVSFAYNTGDNLTPINNRLFLNSVVAKDAAGMTLSPYTFTYDNINGLAGVPYETIKTDHWGYYNGVDPLTGLIFQPGGLAYTPGNFFYYNGTSYLSTIFNTTFKNTYTANRAPVPTAMKYAVLTAVTYPTGGNSSFVWEPNTYSKFVNQAPVGGLPNIAVTSAGGNINGAGLRIRQINSQAGFNSPTLTKDYYYYQDYVNHTDYNSTGVLNSGQPSYFDTYSSAGNFAYQVWSSNNRTNLNYTNGNIITYTKVQEVESDGGFSLYAYTNHDNGYLDKIPAAGFFTDYGNAALQEFHTNSLELERGQLLEKSVYTQNFLLLNKTTNVYNDDVNRFNSNVRRYLFENKFTLNGTIINWQAQQGTNPFSPGGPAFLGANLYALNLYTYYPYLKSETNVSYDQAGGNALTITKNYTYDTYRNKKTETATSSNNEQLVSTFNYPSDAISGLSVTAQAGKTALLQANMVSTVLEKITTRAAVEIDRARNDFQSFENLGTFIVPLNSYKSTSGNALELDVAYHNFDTKGNSVEYIERDGIINSFEFAHNQVYPVVKILNAENTYKSVVVNTPGTTSGSGNLQTGSGGQYATLNTSFNQASTGNITFSLTGSSPPPNVLLTVNYSLTGPSNRSGSLCFGGSGTTCVLPNAGTTVTFASMPPGTYSISATVTSAFTSFPVGTTFNYTYQSINTTTNNSGVKEFFYQGFEETVGAATATPYAGKKYYTGDYTVSYTMPTAKTYLVNYHYLLAGAWINITKNFTNNIVLTEGDAIDEVRVYPADAYMSTYTYDPLVGMTSETEPNGKTMYYEYDSQKRLSLIRDQNKNIVKKICYNYAGQPEDCVGQVYYNSIQTKVFNKSCPVGYTGSAVTYTVAANTYSSTLNKLDAENKALNDITLNGQNYANANGTCTAPVAITGNTNFSYGLPNGSGTITAPPGYVVRVNISATGQPGYTFSLYVTVSGVTPTGSTSVTNGSSFFTFVMPASGTVNWTSSFSAPNSAGGGSISVQ